MSGVTVIILRVVAEIRDIAKGIQENDRQACRLFQRVLAIEPPLLAVQEGTKLSSSESLRQLLTTVEKIRNCLEGYVRTTKFNRALKRKSIAIEFTQLGVILAEGMQALQLDVAVDAWAKEDASDRLEDLENMVDMMDRMERNRTDNHAEVMGVLKALRNDERAELTGWVEIDYGTDLDFEGSNILGSGAFSDVRTAKWNGVDVAVKHLVMHGLHDDTVRSLRKEIRLHSSLRFDHVVQLYAASTIPPHLCLVIELASMGSLWAYLHSTSEPLAHGLQTAFLFDIARGMSFLHTKGILHRDLKSANVLVFANRRLKLCDFGLSKIKTESSSRSKRGAVGTAQWMSPEEMDESPANELTDVYSFGVVCFEVATRVEPFKGLKQAQVTRAVADKGKRPQIPEGASASPDVVPLMEKCWKQDPADRPEGFGPVVRALASVVSRNGDPRIPSEAAVDITPSSGARRGGTAPPTASGGVDASSSWSDPVSQPTGADLGASLDASNILTVTESGSSRAESAMYADVLQRAAKEAVVPGAGRVYAALARKSPPPSSGASSGRFKKFTGMFGRKLRTKAENSLADRDIPSNPDHNQQDRATSHPPVNTTHVQQAYDQLEPAPKRAGAGRRAGVGGPPQLDLDFEGRDFHITYTLGEILGKGVFSTVRAATVTRPGPNKGMMVAVKCVPKKDLPRDDEEELLQEVSILKYVKHPNVIDIYQFFKDDPEMYYVSMEYVRGGELFDRIARKSYYKEQEARDLCRILLDTVRYCHDLGIVHRGLNPENLLLTSQDDDTTVKLADFSFARSITGGLLTTPSGTPGYVAPEMLRAEPHGTPVDMWSIGVTIYILLSGYPPFYDEDQTRLFGKIRSGEFEFHPKYWQCISDEAKDLIRRLLTVDPKKRLTAAQAVTHPWLLSKDSDLPIHNLGVNLEQLTPFNARR